MNTIAAYNAFRRDQFLRNSASDRIKDQEVESILKEQIAFDIQYDQHPDNVDIYVCRDMLKLLLSLGEKNNNQDFLDICLLDAICRGGEAAERLCPMLLKLGADPYSTNNFIGGNVLHICAERVQPKLCRMFLELPNALDIEAKEHDGLTPLFVAILARQYQSHFGKKLGMDKETFMQNQYDTCKVLLDHGATTQCNRVYKILSIVTPSHYKYERIDINSTLLQTVVDTWNCRMVLEMI